LEGKKKKKNRGQFGGPKGEKGPVDPQKARGGNSDQNLYTMGWLKRCRTRGQ